MPIPRDSSGNRYEPPPPRDDEGICARLTARRLGRARRGKLSFRKALQLQWHANKRARAARLHAKREEEAREDNAAREAWLQEFMEQNRNTA